MEKENKINRYENLDGIVLHQFLYNEEPSMDLTVEELYKKVNYAIEPEKLFKLEPKMLGLVAAASMNLKAKIYRNWNKGHTGQPFYNSLFKIWDFFHNCIYYGLDYQNANIFSKITAGDFWFGKDIKKANIPDYKLIKISSKEYEILCKKILEGFAEFFYENHYYKRFSEIRSALDHVISYFPNYYRYETTTDEYILDRLSRYFNEWHYEFQRTLEKVLYPYKGQLDLDKIKNEK